ncbi:MAG TPA: hypothetical protein HPQ04_07635 [Rhodospirillaceae bacterium]|nr:hypothetical protein [Rhodospirillaceae bacterium]
MNKAASWTMGLIATAAAGYWLSLPPDGVALDESCQPSDPQAVVSEILHHQDFWLAQKSAVDEALRAEISLLAGKEKRRDQMNDGRNTIEQRMTRLSNRDVSGDEQAVAQAQREQIARLARLTRCQVAINQKLAP